MQSELPATDEPFDPGRCFYEIGRNQDFQTVPALNFFFLKVGPTWCMRKNILNKQPDRKPPVSHFSLHQTLPLSWIPPAFLCSPRDLVKCTFRSSRPGVNLGVLFCTNSSVRCSWSLEPLWVFRFWEAFSVISGGVWSSSHEFITGMRTR